MKISKWQITDIWFSYYNVIHLVVADKISIEEGHISLETEFKAALAQTIPHLRAYGRSLSGNADVADDLVQDTMLKAWQSREKFKPGTNMRAWTFVILRNTYLTQWRRAKYKGNYDEKAAEKQLFMPADQDESLHLADVQRALMQLPEGQREALILVGAGGFSYEEAANICDVAIGTIKSRVARGRALLTELMDDDNNIKIKSGAGA